MDPLSVTASIVALIGLAGQISIGLQQIYSLHKGPEQLLSVLNELSELRAVLSILEDILVQSKLDVENQGRAGVTERYQAVSSQLEGQMQRAKDLMTKLEELIHRFAPASPGQKRRFSLARWARRRGDFQSVHGDLKALKHGLHFTITMLTHCDTSRISLLVRNIDVGINEIRNWPESLQNDSSLQTGAVDQHLNASLESAIRRSPSIPRVAHDILQIDTSLITNFSCRPCCACKCHRRGGFQTPSFLQSVVGALFLGYLGGPLSQPPCNEPLCSRRSSKGTRITYYFPFWFASFALTMFASAHTVTIHTLPMRGKDDIIFTYASGGNSTDLIKLIDAGSASPLDIDPQGWGLLHVSSDYILHELSLTFEIVGSKIRSF
jgi:hypothetical protein